VRLCGMTEVSIRELRNNGGEVLDSVMRGESVTVTRQGRPIAQLQPIAPEGTPATTLLERWRGIPVVAFDAFRSDLDQILDPML
jgi:prevent-host-death family protein